MKQAKKMLGVLSLGFLYSSMWLLPYIFVCLLGMPVLALLMCLLLLNMRKKDAAKAAAAEQAV